MIKSSEITNLHDAAKLIEYDGIDGYHTCCKKYGNDVANALLVAFLRRWAGSEKQFPEPDGIRDKVNELLMSRGILIKTCPTCGC